MADRPTIDVQMRVTMWPLVEGVEPISYVRPLTGEERESWEAELESYDSAMCPCCGCGCDGD